MTTTSLADERRSRRSFLARDVVAIAGITYRRLDHWTRSGLVHASGHPTTGHGDARWYRDTDVVRIACVAALLNGGVDFADIRRNLDVYIEQGRMERGTVTVTLDVEAIRRCVYGERRAG